MTEKLTELRYQTSPDDSLQLDEIVGTGRVHLENLGSYWFVDVAGVRCILFIRRKTFREWWEDVRFFGVAYLSAWFSFHRIELRANEVDEGPVVVSVDGWVTDTVAAGVMDG